MHVLIIAIAVILVIIILINSRKSDKPDIPSKSIGDLDRYPIALISRGKLFYRPPGCDLLEIQSPYVQSAMERVSKSSQLHGWKEGTTFSVSATGSLRGGYNENIDFRVTSAQFSSADRLIYFLRDEVVGGLFSQDLQNGTENRILHKQNLLLEDLAINPDGDKLLCSAQTKNGSANIAMLSTDGSEYREITIGDTVDTNPAWVPDRPDTVFYQSAGIARNAQGAIIAKSPASIQLLNTKSGDLLTIREDQNWDFMQPKIGADGCLYFIRRPYDAHQYRPHNFLIDGVLFPFRLLRAVFHYLNFFSIMYSRKPLTSAGGPGIQVDLKELLVKGKRFNTEKALRSGRMVSGVPSIVPANWQLIRRTTHGDESVIASHVASFDIAIDGTLLFTNGFGLFALDSCGTPNVVFKGKFMVDIIARQ